MDARKWSPDKICGMDKMLVFIAILFFIMVFVGFGEMISYLIGTFPE